MIFFASFLLFNLLGVLSVPSVDFENDPMQNPDLFEGDIEIYEDYYDRSSVNLPELIWQNGIIPYELDHDLIDTVGDEELEVAFNEYNNKTCLRFIPRTDEEDYIKLYSGDGCHTMVGRRGGEHKISLGIGCGYIGTILHELGHAIGFYHEHTRSDRDQHIIILWDNIIEGKEIEFKKRTPETEFLLTPFDYDSIMLRGSDFLSKNPGRQHTMVSRHKKRFPDIRHKEHLSEVDVIRIKALYNCPM